LATTQKNESGTVTSTGTVTILLTIIASIKKRNALIVMVQTLGLRRVVIERLRTETGVLCEDGCLLTVMMAVTLVDSRNHNVDCFTITYLKQNREINEKES
jgi:hypothetical protein